MGKMPVRILKKKKERKQKNPSDNLNNLLFPRRENEVNN